MASPQAPSPPQDASAALGERIRQATADGVPLRIVGGDTKPFYGRRVAGEALSTREHRGITFYDPVELVVSVRSGTPLAELEAALAEHGQMLGCEPPHLGENATVGGMVATGLSGPRRPWAGSVRDAVLGTRVINHQGVEQRFGGRVMKNVAGYDLSRLMVGAQGTLGLISEVSLKVLPRPRAALSLRLALPLDEALARLADWGREPLPISAAAWCEGVLHLRLEGGERSVADTHARLGGDTQDSGIWEVLREQRLALFSYDDPRPLWRLSLPQHAPPLALPEIDNDGMVHDWGGAQRWLRSDLEAEPLREACARLGGHATCWRGANGQPVATPFHPLAPALERYHRRLKAELDPKGIFNPGRLYAAL